jgi:hypothetical protein
VLTSRASKSIETGEVVKFGPEGKGCPEAKALGEPNPIEAKIDNIKVKELDTSHSVTLSANIQGANVLSTEWSFGDGGNETVLTTAGQQVQAAETVHKFVKSGELTVHATIHTDDLTTPEIKVSTSFHVKETGGGSAPEVTQNPKDQTVAEGETAVFEAKASGEPAPTVQWEVSTDKGATWSNVAGATSGRLELTGTKTSQSGDRYRALFKNTGGEAKTTEATLTVNPPEKPSVTKSPSNVEVEEPQNAAFEASASGAPKPTVQWELSTDKGATWSNVAGGASERLVLVGPKASQSGYEYRADFKNASGEVRSAAATLTVKAKASGGGGGGNGGGGGGTNPSGGSPGGEVLPAKETSPRATVAGASLTVSSSGAVTIKVSCQTGATTCIGSVTLRTLTAVSAGRGRSAKAKKQVLTLAAGSFSVSGGKLQAITLHLSAKGKKLLARLHLLRARATVLAHNPSGQTSSAESVLTLRPAKPARRHH